MTTHRSSPRRDPPLPLVRLKGHPGRWLAIVALMLAVSIVVVHLNTLFTAGLYYAAFESSHWGVTHWHALVPNADLRHNIREVGEGFFAGLGVQFIAYSAYSAWRLRHPRSIRRVRGWTLPLLGVATVLCAVPGFYLGYRYSPDITGWIASGAHRIGLHVTIPSRVPRVVAFERKLAATNWDYKLTGAFASLFLARWPARRLFGELQLLLTERAVWRRGDRPAPWYYLPNWRARYNEVAASEVADDEVVKRRGGVVAVLAFGALAFIALTVLGWWVLTYVAK